MKRRILSALLAMCMVLTMVPAAFAADSDVSLDWTQTGADPAFYTYKLSKDTTLKQVYTIAANTKSVYVIDPDTYVLRADTIVVNKGSQLNVSGSNAKGGVMRAATDGGNIIFQVGGALGLGPYVTFESPVVIDSLPAPVRSVMLLARAATGLNTLSADGTVTIAGGTYDDVSIDSGVKAEVTAPVTLGADKAITVKEGGSLDVTAAVTGTVVVEDGATVAINSNITTLQVPANAQNLNIEVAEGVMVTNYQTIPAPGGAPITSIPVTLTTTAGGTAVLSASDGGAAVEAVDIGNNTYVVHGDTLLVTVNPASGYQTSGVTVTNKDGSTVAQKAVNGNVYSFDMPAADATVAVSFTSTGSSSGGSGNATGGSGNATGGSGSTGGSTVPGGSTGETGSSALPFGDVASTAWYSEAVKYVYENGMMNGTGDGQFSPNATTTRAMIVTILHRLELEPAASASDFADVASGSYYANAVSWAASNNIVNGISSSSFAPNTAITREQLATILYRYASFKGYAVTASNALDNYTDAAQISSYATTAMQWANAEGLITGSTGMALNPKGNATRAEVATILMRFCENVAK